MVFLNDLANLNLATGVLAYVDPGIGSYIFQIMIAGLAALGFFYRAIMTRVKALFGGKSDDKTAESLKTDKAEEVDTTSVKR
jgi:hypothetical protein